MKRNWFIAWHSDYQEIAPIEGISIDDYFNAEELYLSEYGYHIDIEYGHRLEYPGLYWQGVRPSDSIINSYLEDNKQSLLNYGYKKLNYEV